MKQSPLSDKDKLQEICKISCNAAEALEKLNLKASSGNYVTLKKYLKKYDLKIAGFSKIRRRKSFPKRTYSDLDCFKENSLISRRHVKKRIIKDSLIELKCSSCGLGEIWNGKRLVLQLEHINGINNDNRLENLQFLCPNCHSQTKTYGGNNKKYTSVV